MKNIFFVKALFLSLSLSLVAAIFAFFAGILGQGFSAFFLAHHTSQILAVFGGEAISLLSCLGLIMLAYVTFRLAPNIDAPAEENNQGGHISVAIKAPNWPLLGAALYWGIAPLALAWVLAIFMGASITRPIIKPEIFTAIVGFALTYMHALSEQTGMVLLAQKIGARADKTLARWPENLLAILRGGVGFCLLQGFQGYHQGPLLLNSALFGAGFGVIYVIAKGQGRPILATFLATGLAQALWSFGETQYVTQWLGLSLPASFSLTGDSYASAYFTISLLVSLAFFGLFIRLVKTSFRRAMPAQKTD